MPFLTDLEVKILSGGDAVLIKPLVYSIPGTSNALTIPAGFITDFASIPRLARALITGQDDTRLPAVLHDYLYRKRVGKRGEADALFRIAMKECGVPAWQRWLAWSAVRIGGWVAWNE